MEVLAEIPKKVKDLKDENDNCLSMIKDLEDENDSCMERVKHLQKEEKENSIYKVRDKFFMYALLLLWFLMLLVACVALTK
jgi:hypothetical protein